jgi:hypothetical protein
MPAPPTKNGEIMPLLQSDRLVLASLMGLILFAGCDSGPTNSTTPAPTGHEGKTGGGPAAPAPAPAAK